MTTQVSTQVNGVNVEQLMTTVNAIKDNPDLARFQFRAHTEWLDGGHSRTAIKEFYGAGQEDTSRSMAFTMEGDEPPVLLGNKAGPNAVETALHALASCLSVALSTTQLLKELMLKAWILTLKEIWTCAHFLAIQRK
jgi:hypothetical protein